ncbi:MAG: class I SAM-dependent methyltransferase [Burkholderiaceae bacterium]
MDVTGEADVHADLRHLPFPDASADRIAAIHVLEHFYLWEAGPLLAEWKRVLKPGGELILELPCLDKVFQYIHDAIDQGLQDFWAPMTVWALWGDPKYQDARMSHRWGYTYLMLGRLLEQAGWEWIAFTEPRYHLAVRDMRATAKKGVV